MKEVPLSNCEKNFILKAALKLKRLDGRKLENFRTLKVLFGQNWGLCYVSLGETKVLTQVTCEIQEPKTTRPNEGLLFVNVELSSMAAPHFESGRPSDLSVQINRLLEKCLKDSKAVDLESLCIVAEEKVWVLRVDVNVLNHDGNLIDCASISALAALAHFKRPDVTINGQEIKVHDASERDPLPITLHHYPVCVSFALLNNSENIFADPTDIEERVSDASLTFAINAYKEICCLHLGGVALIKPKIILTCSIKAAERAREIVEIIKNALIFDSEDRYLKKSMGFVDNFEWKKNTAMSEEKPKIQLSNTTQRKEIESFSEISLPSDKSNEKYKIINLGENCAELTSAKSNKEVNTSSVAPNFKKLEENGKFEQVTDSYGEGGFSKWLDSKPEFTNQSNFDNNVMWESIVEPQKMETVEILSDSEEEEVIILSSNDVNNHQNSSANYENSTQNPFDAANSCRSLTTYNLKKKKKSKQN